MRIHFDEEKEYFKHPFGCVEQLQNSTYRILIPASVKATEVLVVMERDGSGKCEEFYLRKEMDLGDYEAWFGRVQLLWPGLYFYYFRITGHTGTFRLFRCSEGTNMEAGDKWQVSCVPKALKAPAWAEGAVIYQIFPDRFARFGSCDLSQKTGPYTLHENWDEEVSWQPDEEGRVLNNDFFGGNFRGISKKIDYIASLGVDVIYLNPISKSFSSHRYDTGDYKTPDPMLGTEEDFRKLCRKAHRHGIKVILDGVFAHTGADSLYFNKYGNYGEGGAYRDPESPYRSWYRFRDYPDSYDSWWGFDTLPTVNKMDPSYIDYIITAPDSVVAYWLELGADGFRLDVADELPDKFLQRLWDRVKELKPNSVLLGEVWEDASNKISHGVRRSYFTQAELNGVTNYPFRTAILNFLRGVDDGQELRKTVYRLMAHYPRTALLCSMNLLGTHDTPRILTALVDDFDGDREQLAQRFLTPEQRKLAKQRLKLASVLQYALPGSPCLYYGDEVGMEGGKDPFNRRTYPWGREDQELLEHYRKLGQLRKKYPVLRRGDFRFLAAENGEVKLMRFDEKQIVMIYVNQKTNAFWVKVINFRDEGDEEEILMSNMEETV